MPTGAPQLGGELLPGRPRADHEHAARRELIRPAVARGVQLRYGRRRRCGSGRDPRDIAVAGGNHHVRGVPSRAVGRDVVARSSRGARAIPSCRSSTGRPDRVRLEVGDDAVAVQVAVRIGQRRRARQPVQPVRRQEVQGVPALRAPALTDTAALEDDVPAARGAQLVAQRQAGLAGPDDDRLDAHGSANDGCTPERDVAEEVVRSVVAEWMHERAGPHVAVCACERRSVEVAGAAGHGERPVDDAGRRVADEGLGRLAFGEQGHDVLVGAGRRRVGGVVLVDQRCGARERGARGRQVDHRLGDQHPGARVVADSVGLRSRVRTRIRRCRATPTRGRGRAAGCARRTGRWRRSGSRRVPRRRAAGRPRT